jgi:hypothetical protein
VLGPAPRGVMVVYERGEAGRAALLHAHLLAGDRARRGGVIVLPARGSRLRRLFSRDRVKLLEGRTTAVLVIAPDRG